MFPGLPFQAIWAIMIKYMAMKATRKLNFFPPKGEVSQYYSPQEIFHHEKLDYNKHYLIAQFLYVQAHTEPNPLNSQAP